MARDRESHVALAPAPTLDERAVRLADHRRTVRLAIFVLGLIGLTIAFRQAVQDSRGEVLPGPGAMVVAGALTLASIVLAAQAWTSLFDASHDRRALAASLYASQLTKYLPAGGFVQAAGQVSMSVTAGARVGQAATAAAVWAWTTVVAGCTLTAGLVFATSLPGWARAASLCGLLAPALLHRRALALALHAAHRVIRRVPDPDVLPTQRRIVVSFSWSLANAVAGSSAYAVLLGALDTGVAPVTVVSAFALSWVAGFLVFPLPSGIGVREAVLVAVIPGVSSAALLGAALAQRFLVLASEATATAGNHLIARRVRRRHGAPSASGTVIAGDGGTELPATDAEIHEVDQLSEYTRNGAHPDHVRTRRSSEAS
jgi:glycosyltransferase 2 family protein